MDQVESGLGAFGGALFFNRWESATGAFAMMAAPAAVAMVAALSIQRAKARPM